MNSNPWWEIFLRTGKVSDYINYKRSFENVAEDYANKDGWANNRTKENW
jgi:hypothetical protein